MRQNRRAILWIILLIISFLVPTNLPVAAKNTFSGLRIFDVVTNEGAFPGGNVPKYEKFEISFHVDTIAKNFQLPFDTNTPPGITAGEGISIDAQFTRDNWQTVYTQPAFYYQEFYDEIKVGREWFYPTGSFSWKVRFAPNQTGTWQYKLVARDASGVIETIPMQFQVVESSDKGFIRVSQKDSRYFEFNDGSYFPGLGYNMNYDHVSWYNPILDNQDNFEAMSNNGIQLVRIWLSQWGIYGSSWNPWNSIDPNLHAQYIPYTGLTFEQAYPGSDVSMEINASYNPCMFIGAFKAAPALKRNTNYRVRIRYKTADIAGPRVSGQPFGFVAKIGGWLWGGGNDCQNPGTGEVITSYQSQDTSDWQVLEGSFNSGSNDFLPDFYLVMENVNQGSAYVDNVWIEEDLGNGTYGPNVVSKPWMAQHKYFEQRNSYAFDKLLYLAKQYGIYLKPVILEKNDWLFNRFDYSGNPIPDNPACWDADPNNDPPECPDNKWFYGDWRNMTKIRWLQRAWWRYIQARWGYSTNIHSWELLNEGDPWNGLHYTLADEFGKYMHQFKPDDHLVTTSFWHSFPKDSFWANSEYANVDYADYHRYIGESESGFLDTAWATSEVSGQFGATKPGGAGKPVIRGETGFVVSGSGPATTRFQPDSQGIWLHNFVWGGINSGGLIESYWYENTHIYKLNGNQTLEFDHRDTYASYYNFIKNIPLNNGNYQDVKAQVSDSGLRVLGQKDLVNGRAHLWIQNKNHLWENVVNGTPIPSVTGDVTISGFHPGEEYAVQWWDPYAPGTTIIRTERKTASSNGDLVITVTNLQSDLALKIFPPRFTFLPFTSRKK